MNLKMINWVLLLIFAFYSCNTSGNKREFISTEVAMNNETFEQPKVEKVEPLIERKIIKEGEISFETGDLNETESLITRTVNEMGGYVANDNVFTSEERITHRMTLRVPADKFDQLILKISESAKKLDRKTVSELDVEKPVPLTTWRRFGLNI